MSCGCNQNQTWGQYDPSMYTNYDQGMYSPYSAYPTYSNYPTTQQLVLPTTPGLPIAPTPSLPIIPGLPEPQKCFNVYKQISICVTGDIGKATGTVELKVLGKTVASGSIGLEHSTITLGGGVPGIGHADVQLMLIEAGGRKCLEVHGQLTPSFSFLPSPRFSKRLACF